MLRTVEESNRLAAIDLVIESAIDPYGDYVDIVAISANGLSKLSQNGSELRRPRYLHSYSLSSERPEDSDTLDLVIARVVDNANTALDRISFTATNQTAKIIS